MRRVRLPIFCILASFLLFMLESPGNVFASDEQKNDHGCIFMSETLTIPDDGSWLQICLVDLSAPDSSTVTETNVKVVVNHPNPAQLEILLTRADSEITFTISPDEISTNGMEKSTAIHDFNGLPSQGEWRIQIRDTVPGIVGSVKSVSVAADYAPIGKRAQPISDNNGKPTSERVAAKAVRISKGTERDEKDVRSDLVDMNQANTDYSVPIMTETFELMFPESEWQVYDVSYDPSNQECLANPNSTSGICTEYYWDDDNYESFSGSWAAWPANGGADAKDPANSTYPQNVDTWMIYGPFDLSNAKSASVGFWLLLDNEVNFDRISFGASGDNLNYNETYWDGTADWDYKPFDLNPFLGDSSVWIGWHFKSDNSIQLNGPWIDDIMLKFEPGDVTIEGNFTYADRSSNIQGAKGTKVQLWDSDTYGDDMLAETIISENDGHYSFPAVRNWDLDDTDPILSNRRLDIYVSWVLENNDYKVTKIINEPPYAWRSTPTRDNIGMGTATISSWLPAGWTKLQAMWIFQDIRRTREYYLGNTSPQSDPGFLTAHWEENQDYDDGLEGSHFWALADPYKQTGPHVFIAHSSVISVDTMVHELGHHIMWNKTGQWLWYEFNCFDHNIFSQESIQCAWSEGWADFLAITVNQDTCYDFDEGPCTGAINNRHYNLENHTRLDNALNFAWGDGVEGRVAGSLYDLLDASNESPWYDSATWGFDQIVDIALAGSGQSSLHDFWSDYQGNDKHNGVRSIYQNTIDYDQAPVFTAIPEQNTLQNHFHSHIIDLWDYSSDVESQDAFLIYELVYVSDSRCGVSLDSHWINANPQMNWIGSCNVTVRVNDSIPNETSTGSFLLNVLQINSRNFLPVIMKQ